jgi:hypothetical protein
MTKSQLIAEIISKQKLQQNFMIGSPNHVVLDGEIAELDMRLLILTGRSCARYSKEEQLSAIAEVELLV